MASIFLCPELVEQFFISSFISLEVSLSEDNFLHNKRLHKRVTAIAQWIRLNLQSCGPGFECQAKHLCFRLYDGDLNAVGWGEGPWALFSSVKAIRVGVGLKNKKNIYALLFNLNLNCYVKRTKIKRKEAGNGPYLKKMLYDIRVTLRHTSKPVSYLFLNHSHPSGFHWGHHCSWTLA